MTSQYPHHIHSLYDKKRSEEINESNSSLSEREGLRSFERLKADSDALKDLIGRGFTIPPPKP